MTRMQGTVRRIQDGLAEVEVIRSSGCGRCHEPGGCGGGTLATGQACPKHYWLPNTIDARPGDKVWLTVQDGSVLRAALWAYGLPGGLMVAGAVLVSLLQGSDLMAFVGALAGLAVGFVGLRFRSGGSVGTAGTGGSSVTMQPDH